MGVRVGGLGRNRGRRGAKVRFLFLPPFLRFPLFRGEKGAGMVADAVIDAHSKTVKERQGSTGEHQADFERDGDERIGDEFGLHAGSRCVSSSPSLFFPLSPCNTGADGGAMDAVHRSRAGRPVESACKSRRGERQVVLGRCFHSYVFPFSCSLSPLSAAMRTDLACVTGMQTWQRAAGLGNLPGRSRRDAFVASIACRIAGLLSVWSGLEREE